MKKKKGILIGILILSTLLSILTINLKVSYAQDEAIDLPQNFLLNEISEINGTRQNQDSIDIPLPSSQWNVSDVDLQFTDINFTRQILEVENESGLIDSDFVNKNGNEGLSVQIKITHNTRIYGAYIYGYVSAEEPGDEVNIQIRGYNQTTNIPNNTVYIQSQNLNMTDGLQWWYQNLSSPIDLSPGNYSLVLNQTTIVKVPTRYRWYHKLTQPKNQDLHTSIYGSDGKWSLGINGTPYVYKLDQKVIADFYPEDFDMRAVINGIPRIIYNGMEPNIGNLSISNIDFSPLTEILNIPIFITQPFDITFNVSYNIIVNDIFFVDSIVTISENSENRWSLIFNINRTNGNYTVKFFYANGWENFTIFRNEELLTEEGNYTINPDEKYISILNNSIPNEILQWEIKAECNKTDFNLIVPRPEFGIGEELQFGLTDPLFGNYTFILYNSLGFFEFNSSTTYEQGDGPTFSYTIPSNARSGEWKALIYWNNGSDAGVQTQIFTIRGVTTLIPVSGGGGGGDSTKVVTGWDPILVLTISLIIIIGTTGSLSSYIVYKKIKTNREEHLQKLHNKFRDILSLNYIMVLEKKSGLNVYEEHISGKDIDPTLVSGFLEAVRSFGIQLSGS